MINGYRSLLRNHQIWTHNHQKVNKRYMHPSHYTTEATNFLPDSDDNKTGLVNFNQWYCF